MMPARLCKVGACTSLSSDRQRLLAAAAASRYRRRRLAALVWSSLLRGAAVVASSLIPRSGRRAVRTPCPCGAARPFANCTGAPSAHRWEGSDGRLPGEEGDHHRPGRTTGYERPTRGRRGRPAARERRQLAPRRRPTAAAAAEPLFRLRRGVVYERGRRLVVYMYVSVF